MNYYLFKFLLKKSKNLLKLILKKENSQTF